MRGAIRRACAVLDRATWAIMAALLALMSALVIGETFSRYLFNQSTTWVEELTRYLMVWMTMIGGATALYRGELVGMTFVADRLPRPMHRVLIRTVLLLIAAFLVVVVYQGYHFVQRSWVLSAPAMQVPMAWFYMAVPIGAALMLLQTIGLLIAPPEADPALAHAVPSE